MGDYVPDEIEKIADEVTEKHNKTMWRCVNNHVFGYCKGEPDWETPPEKDTYGEIRTGSCNNDWQSCMKFRYLGEMVDLSKLPPPKLVGTFTPPENKEPKAKKAKANKPKQVTMFDEQ